jgi:Putative zinc-finger
MNQTPNTQTCARANDLISFLYGEVGERDARDFEKHLHHCGNCQSEIASFTQVRGAIGEWKTEVMSVLSHAYDSKLAQPLKQKSAIAALKEFFALAPFWMKSAVTFATVLFCVLAVRTVGRLASEQPQPKKSITSAVASDAKYSEQEMRSILERALAERTVQLTSNRNEKPVQKRVLRRENTGRRVQAGSAQMTRGRRPLTKSELEQLAADLRLFSTRDDEGLNLLGDRISQ